MKRSLSAPCLAEEGSIGSKKVKEESNEPTGREYLQLALARVLELQRQVKDETYTTDNTSDLGESDSEEDVMKEVLIKVFKDLPGSSPAVTSIINRATRSQPPQVHLIRDKRVQLSGYDTCRRVALEFMNTVVKNTPITERDFERFEMGTFSRIETKVADHKTGLTESRGENSKSNLVGSRNRLGSADASNPNSENPVGISSRNYVPFTKVLSYGGIVQFAKLQDSHSKQVGNNSNHFRRCEARNLLSAEDNANNINRGIDKSSQSNGSRHNYLREVENPRRSFINVSQAEKEPLSRDYEIRIRMLKGLDLHLATKQRDFTARLMRQ